MAVDISETAAPQDVDDTEDTDDAVVEKPPMESTRRGRLLISAFVLVLLVALFGANMPDSVLKAGLLKVAQPVLNVTGLDQAWGVFAPNPPRDTGLMFARVDHADGTTDIRQIPVSSGISEYWNYRWNKYNEVLPGGVQFRPEQQAYSRWIADQDRDAGGRPVRVTLVKRIHDLAPPGPQPDRGPDVDVPLFSMAVTP